VSQTHPIIPASVSRFRPIRSRPAADECKPLHIGKQTREEGGKAGAATPGPWLTIAALVLALALGCTTVGV